MESDWLNLKGLDDLPGSVFEFEITSNLRFRLDCMNSNSEELKDLFRPELCGKFLDEILPREVLENISPYFRQCVETGQTVFFEGNLFGDDRRRHMKITLIPLRDAADSPKRLICRIVNTGGIQPDPSYKFMNIALDNVLQAIFLTDEHARFQYVNEEACRSLGYSRQELLGMGIADIDPVFPVDRWPEYWQRRSNSLVTFETSHKTKDGRIFPVEINACLVEYDGQRYSLSFARDISERKKFESELMSHQERLRNLYLNLQAMRENERTNIAREIHDELGQVMMAIKMDIAWLRNKFTSNEEVVNKISATLGLIDVTIQSIKKICTQLRPGILDHLGIGAAIQWQAEEFQKRTGIRCDVSINGTIDVDSERSTALFRILQEALTNVMRHADATHVLVNLETRDRSVILEIIDNGRGIADEEISKPDSFGILGMHERVYPWKGNVSISSSPNKGTRITATLPCA